MNRSTPPYTRLRQLRASAPARDDVREQRQAVATSCIRKSEPKPDGYYAQIDDVLKRVRDDKSFGAVMIRSILGHVVPRGSSR